MTHIKRRYVECGSTAKTYKAVTSTTVLQPKFISKEARIRMQELRNVIHSTFISNVPSYQVSPWDANEYKAFRSDLYDAFLKTKDRIRDIAVTGGKDYDELLFNAKFAHTDYETMRKVRLALV